MDVAPLLRLPEPCLVVLVGAAGSGKSSFAARHFDPSEVLSSDGFRALVAGDPADQRATGAAFAALHRELRRRLADRRTTVVDATNVTGRARAALLRSARGAGVPAVAVVLDLPAALVLTRNAARPGRAAVPEPAVRIHLDLLERALAERRLEREGFAAVWVLRDPADIERVRVQRG